MLSSTKVKDEVGVVKMELSGGYEKNVKGNKGDCLSNGKEKVSFVLLTQEDREYLTSVIWLILDGLVLLNPSITKEYVQELASKWKELAISPTKRVTLYGALTDTLNNYFLDENKQIRERLTLKTCTLVDILMELHKVIQEVALTEEDFLVDRGLELPDKELEKLIEDSGFIYKSYPDYYILAVKDRDLNILLRDPTFIKVINHVYGKESKEVGLIKKYINEDLKIKHDIEAIDINVLDADLSLLIEYISKLRKLPVEKAKVMKKRLIRIHKITVN